MNITCSWFVKLPFYFALDVNIPADNTIKIDEVIICLNQTETSKFFDALNIKMQCVLDDAFIDAEFLDSGSTSQEMFGFIKNITHYVGERANKFVNAYYRIVDNSYFNQIYNGDCFIAPYKFCIVNNDNSKVVFCLDSMSSACVVGKSTLRKIEEDIVSQHNLIDELFRVSDCFLENGLFEMSIMNLAMVTEAFIKSYVSSHGIKKQELEDEKGDIDKYYNKGLKLITGKSLKEEHESLYRILLNLNDIRNKIAHGGNMYELEIIKNKTSAEIYDLVFDFQWNIEDIFEWINSLEIIYNL